MSKIPEWMWKSASLLVIPLLAWGVKLEVNRAVTNSEVAALKTDAAAHTTKIVDLQATLGVQSEKVRTLSVDLKEARGMQSTINTNTNALGKLEVKIDAVSTSLIDIKDLLRKP